MATLQEMISQAPRNQWDLDYSRGWSSLRPEVQQRLADFLASGRSTSDILKGELGVKERSILEDLGGVRASSGENYWDNPEYVNLYNRYADLARERQGYGIRANPYLEQKYYIPTGELVNVIPNTTGGFNVSTSPEYEGAYFNPSEIEFDPYYGLYTSKRNFAGELEHDRGIGKFMNAAIPAVIMGMATGGIGSALGGALGGGAAASAAGYGVAGAGTGALNAAMQGGDVGRGALVGGVGGALGGAAGGLSSMGAQQLIEAGMNPTLAGALASGVTRAGTGAIGAGLLGGDVGQAALSGLVSGAAGSVNPALGTLAKLGMGALAGSPQAPATPTARSVAPSPVSRGPLGTLASGAGGLLPSQAQGRRGTGSGGMAGLTGLGLRGLY